MVNGLLKTAQGACSGVATSLVSSQDAMIKLEAMRCLVAFLRSMGEWMNKQMRIPDPHAPSCIGTIAGNIESMAGLPMENGNIEAHAVGLDSETINGGVSEAAALEQCQGYELGLQVDLLCLSA